MKIIDILESTRPIKSDIRNGKPVIGHGFNSNGRDGQGGLIRDRFRSRINGERPVARRC